MATKKSTSHKGRDTAFGALALTAAAVGAAGAYFLAGSKNAAQNRKKVKSWALKAKAEVLEELENAKKMSQEEYQDLLESVAGAYESMQGVSKKDIKEFKEEMEGHWKKLERSFAKKKPAAKKVAKKAKKVAKKAAKKTTKKTTKKA